VFYCSSASNPPGEPIAPTGASFIADVNGRKFTLPFPDAETHDGIIEAIANENDREIPKQLDYKSGGPAVEHVGLAKVL